MKLSPEFIFFKSNIWTSGKIELFLNISEKDGQYNARLIMKDADDYTVEKEITITKEEKVQIQLGP